MYVALFVGRTPKPTSVAMMLDHLGLSQAARDVEAAVAKDLATRGDAKRSTTQVGDALLALL